MLVAIFVLSLINLVGLIIAGCLYFKETYCIVSIEHWNEIATVYNTVVTAGLVDEKGELTSPPELAGGCGSFFRDQLEEDYYEDDE
ncbi:MAG: hypothetical protein II393_02375 [Cytophagales bacterium]|nr:hypothetical protein [Cytophagales bacterium]